jgi:hypothetical protein
MNNQTDHGFSAADAVSLRCVACGSSELDCCDGEGGPLPEAVKVLLRMKRNLEHQRRFGFDTLIAYRNACAHAEGDIEEWLIENGYLQSQD